MKCPSFGIAALAVAMVWGVGCETGGTSKKPNGAARTTPEAKRPRTESPKPENRPGPGPYRYATSIGSKGDKPGQFHNPVGLAVDASGNIYVADTHNKRLQKIDPDGEAREVWAEGIERPMHLALGRDGRLLVPVFQADEIRVFDGPGPPVETFGGDWVDAPAGVAQGPDGIYYVADFYNHRLHVVSPAGELEKTIGREGKAPGEFTYPTDVAVEPDGTVWIADAYAHRLQAFSPDLKHQRTIGGWGKEKAGRFRVATGIDVGPQGKLYVADFKNDRVQVLRPDGTPLAIIDGGESGDGALEAPTAVVRTKSKLYVTDHGHHQIDVYAVDESDVRQ